MQQRERKQRKNVRSGRKPGHQGRAAGGLCAFLLLLPAVASGPAYGADTDPRVLFSPVMQVAQVRAPQRRVEPLIATPDMQGSAPAADMQAVMAAESPEQSQRISLDDFDDLPPLPAEAGSAGADMMLANPQDVIPMVGREFIPRYEQMPAMATAPAAMPEDMSSTAEVMPATPVTQSARSAPSPTPLTRQPRAQAMPTTREFQPRYANEGGGVRTAMVGRTFTPFSSTGMLPEAGMMPRDAGFENVLQRFAALKTLRDMELITPAEYATRRTANVGALLPYSQTPPSAGLTRAVPDQDDIVARLQALRRSLEMRAISARQHELERTMILNALLPASARTKALAPPPPADVLGVAAYVGRLEGLREQGLITQSEFDGEAAAVEALAQPAPEPQPAAAAMGMQATAPVTTGSGLPLPGPGKKGDAAALSGQGKAMMGAGAGLSVHLASYRSLDAALTGWAEISTKHHGILAAYQPDIKPVQVPGKGMYYRIYVGPVASDKAAGQLCARLKSAGQYCDSHPVGG